MKCSECNFRLKRSDKYKKPLFWCANDECMLHKEIIGPIEVMKEYSYNITDLVGK